MFKVDILSIAFYNKEVKRLALVVEFGIHNRLKICRRYWLAGSSPVEGTILDGLVTEEADGADF